MDYTRDHRPHKRLILLAIVLFSLAYYPFAKEFSDNARGADFVFYYEAARGNIDYKITDARGIEFGYFYKPWTALIWKPFTFFDYNTAHILWYFTLVVFWAFLVFQLIEIKCCGLLAVLFSFYLVRLNLDYAQVNIMLVALCLSPVGVLFAICLKPYCALFALLHIYKNRKRVYQEWLIIYLIIVVFLVLLHSPNDEIANAAFVNFTNSKVGLIYLLPLYYFAKTINTKNGMRKCQTNTLAENMLNQ